MAKKTFDVDGGGFGDNLDYTEDFDAKPKSFAGKSRKAITDFSGSALDSSFNNFKDTDKWKRAIADELPPQHRFIYDSYESAKRTGDELYDQFVKETRPILGDITKKLDDMVDSDSRFKSITAKLKDKFYDPPATAVNQSSLDEEALSKVMAETFGGIDMLAQQRSEKSEKQETARAITEQQIGQEQHSELLRVLSPMQDTLARIETFKLQVETKIARKQLELQFRSYLVQGRTYEHLRKSHIELMEQVKVMVSNTGLPDYAKIEKGERFKEMMRDRAMDGVQNALFGKDTAIGQMLGRFKNDIRTGINTFTMALQGAASGIDFMDGMVGKDSGMNIFESLGMVAGGEVGDFGRKKLIKPLMDKLKENPEFQRKGFNMAQLVRDPRLLFDLLKNNDKFKGIAEGSYGTNIEDILKRFETYLNPQQNLGKFGKGAGGLMAAGIPTERLNRTHTDVVPGFLALILQQVTSFNTKKPSALMRYDFGSNTFVESGGMANKINRMVREYNEKSAYTEGALSRSGDLLTELGLKAEDKETLASVLSTMSRSKSTVKGGKISDFAEYDTMSEGERKILERINSFAGFDKDEKTSGTMYKVRTAADELRGLGDNMSGFIQRLIDEGHADLLIEEGLIEIDPDKPGAYRTRGSHLEKLQRRSIYRATSDVNAKGSFKKLDKSRALNGIRRTPVSSWRYKGNGRRRIGPMAQDVNRNLGEDAAPGGVELDLVSMNGAAMAAIQKLAEDQENMMKADNGVAYLKAIAKGVGVGEPNAIADPTFSLVDYARLAVDGISKTNFLLENNRFNIPGFDFSGMSMPDLSKLKENGQKFVDPLIRTGNKYIDGLQSALFSAIQDGFEGVKPLPGKARAGLRGAKETLIDKPFGFIMDVLMRNEKDIKDRTEWLYKKSIEAAGKAIDFGTSILTETIPAKIKGMQAFVKNMKDSAKRIINPPRDIYIKGRGDPVMTGARMRSRSYVDETGKHIIGIDDLLSATGNITDIHIGGVVVTSAELADGVYDQEGTLLRSTAQLGIGLLGAGAQLLTRGATAGYKWLQDGPSFLDKGKAAIGQIKSGLSGFLENGLGLGSLGTDARLLRLTAQIRDLLAIGKPKKFVSAIYNRDLRKHPLEGTDFLAMLYGQGFVDKFFGTKGKPGAQGGNGGGGSGGGGGGGGALVPSNGGGGGNANDPSNPTPATGLGAKMKQAFGSYNKSQSFGTNFTAALGALGVKDPGKAASTAAGIRDAVKDKANKSKTFNWFKDKYTKAKADYQAEQDGTAPKKDGFFRRQANKARGGFNNLRGRFGRGKAQAADWEVVDDGQGPNQAPALGYNNPADDGVSDVESRPVQGPAQNKRTGIFGRMANKARNSRTGRNIGKAFRAAKGLGVFDLAAGAAKGIGNFLLGGSGPEADVHVPGGQMHALAGPATHATISDNKTGKATFYDADGDGVRDNGSTKALIRHDEERRAQQVVENEKAKESQERAAALLESRKAKQEDNFFQSLLSGAGSLLSFLTSGFGGMFKMLGGLGKAAGAIFGVGKKLVGGVAKGALGLGKAALKGGGARAVAIRGLGAAAAIGAGMGGSAGMALGAASLVARFALGPVGLALTAAQVAWWAGSKIYKHVKRNDTDEFGKVRMAQYGLGENQKEHYHKFLALEDYLKEHVSWSGGSPSVNTRSMKPEEILEIFDIDKNDAAAAEKMGDWFENRFKPFFYNALASARYASPKASYFDVKDFTRPQLEKLASKLEYPAGPYDSDTSPIKELPSLPNTYSEVKGLVEVLKNSKTDKEKKDLKTNNKLESSLKSIAAKNAGEQDRDLAEKEKKAKEEKEAADKESNKAKGERDKLAQARGGREEATARAMASLQAASNGRNFASNYRDETNRLLESGKSVVGGAVSDDGGKEKPAPSEGQQGQENMPSMSSIPMASGALADASKGLAGAIIGKGVDLDNMNPTVRQSFMAMLAEYNESTGKKVRVTDGHRDRNKQARLYASLPAGQAAKPGSSLHEFGAALDVSSEDANTLEKLGLLRKYGFTRPVGGEPWHLEPAGIQGQLDKAKKDPNFLSDMMEKSHGRGGGGIATLSNVRKYSRNDSYAMKVFGEGVSTTISLPKAAANDAKVSGPTIAATGAPVPTSGGTPGESGPRTQNRLSGVNIVGGKDDRPKTFGEGAPSITEPSTPATGTVSSAKPVIQGGDASAGGGRGSVNPDSVVPNGEGEKEASPPGKTQDTSASGGPQAVKEKIGKFAKEAGGDPSFMQVMAGLESSMAQRMSPHMGSAMGPFQFMPPTWREQLGKNGAKYNLSANTSPMDLRASTVLASEYFESNEGPVKSIRGSKFDIVDRYFTHMLGRGGAATFAKMPDDAIAANVLTSAAKYNRNVFFDEVGRAYTAGEVRANQKAKIQSVANTYGVNISHLLGNDGASNDKSFDTGSSDSGFDSGPSPQTGPQAGPSTGPQAGSVTGQQTSEVETRMTKQQDSVRSEEFRRVSSSSGPEVVSRPAVQTNQGDVSGTSKVSAASAKDNTELVRLGKRTVEVLENIDLSLTTLLDLYGDKKTSSANAEQPASRPRSPDAAIMPRSRTERSRTYGT